MQESKPNDVIPLRWVVLLFGCVITLFAGLFVVILIVRNLPPPREIATQCVKEFANFCMVGHGGGNEHISGGIVNVCDKPITDIYLHGIAYSTFDNSILGDASGPVDGVLPPNAQVDYDLLVPNTYWGDGDYLYCTVEATSAYFVK